MGAKKEDKKKNVLEKVRPQKGEPTAEARKKREKWVRTKAPRKKGKIWLYTGKQEGERATSRAGRRGAPGGEKRKKTERASNWDGR